MTPTGCEAMELLWFYLLLGCLALSGNVLGFIIIIIISLIPLR